MHYVRILTITAVTLLGLSWALGQGKDKLGALPPGFDSSLRQDLVPEIDLYKRPDPDGGLTERQREIKAAAPELFKTEGVIVVFGAEWCRWCKAQVADLKGPSFKYNVLVYDLDEEKGSLLADLLEVGDSVPVTMIVEKGVVTKTFLGFTPWAEIKPHAEKAAKNEDDKKGSVNIGPIRIDWDTNGFNLDIERYRRSKRRT